MRPGGLVLVPGLDRTVVVVVLYYSGRRYRSSDAEPHEAGARRGQQVHG